MRSAAEAAHLLLQGLLEIAAWPEFEDEAFIAEVKQRLDAVGYELGSADGYWLAYSRERDDTDGFRQVFQLNQAEYAVLAALYLHLRFLPRQVNESKNGASNPSVAVEDIERGFPGYTVETVRRILGRLRNLLFIKQLDERLYAGPYLSLIDAIVADERAAEAVRDFKLRSYLSRRLAALGERIDAAD
jgi:hypothetical protein